MNRFSFIKERARQTSIELAKAQIDCDNDPINRTLKEIEMDLRKEALRLDKAATQFLKQKAKGVHLIESDKSSTYFYSMVKRKHGRNTVSFLCRADSTTDNNIDTIRNDFVEFYSNLFGVSVDRTPVDPLIFQKSSLVSAEDQTYSVRNVSDMEIREALFSIGSDKAPGPDGYTSAFFKNDWNLLGPQVQNAVREFFNKGILLRKLNHTVVSLIPKKAYAPTVSDFRPISYTNVLYKIIIKIL